VQPYLRLRKAPRGFGTLMFWSHPLKLGGGPRPRKAVSAQVRQAFKVL